MIQQLRELRTAYGDDLVRSVLIREGIKRYRSTTSADLWVLDLNPHLETIRACKLIAAEVVQDGEGVQCSEQDVMLYWLTDFLVEVHS